MPADQTNNRVFNTKVRTYDDGKFSMQDQPLVYPGPHAPNGIGEFIDYKAYDQYIKQTYGDQIALLEQNPDADIPEQLILFEVGKTVIQMILAQEGCEGIRLIAVKRSGTSGMENSFIVEGITKDMHAEGIARSVQGLDGFEPVKSEEVHGRKLKDVYTILKGHGTADKKVDVDAFIDALRNGSGSL